MERLWKSFCKKCFVISLENPMDGEASWAAVHRVAKSRTRLSNFTFTLHFHALEKETATHSSVLAWRIPGTGEPGGLPSMGSHRVGHDWSDSAAAAPASPSRNTASIVITLWKITHIFQFYIVFEVQVLSAARVIKNLMLKGYFNA